MKKILHKMKKYGVVTTALLAVMRMFGCFSRVQAGETSSEPYDANQKGSITVKLPELSNMDNEDVEITIYRVGNLDTSQGYLNFSLVDELKDEKVDLNDIPDSEANTALAETLLNAVEAKKIAAAGSLRTDAEGQVTFRDLSQGMYLIVQTNVNAYGTFSPFVLSIPHGTQTTWEYDMVIEPKVNPVTTLGRIDVTKKLKGLDAGDLMDVEAKNATYYIGLFTDPEGKYPYRGQDNAVKPVHIINGNSGTVSFSNIPITDQPYYIFETTADGKPIEYLKMQGTDGAFYCMAGEELLAEGYDRAPEISLEKDPDSIGTAVISNVYSDLPDGFYYTGGITITKSIMNDGQMVTSQDTFYAGIFPVDDQGQTSTMPIEVVTLKNNGSVTVEVPLGGSSGEDPITYAVKETDEQGNPVDKNSFLYVVTGEGNVNLSKDSLSATVNITNTLKDNDGYYEEPSTSTTESGSGSNGNDTNENGSSGSNRSSRSTKTGDENPIAMYLGLLAAAVVVGGIVIVRRKKHTDR